MVLNAACFIEVNCPNSSRSTAEYVRVTSCYLYNNIILARTPEIGQGLGRILSLLPLLFLLVVGDVINAVLLSQRNKGLRWTMNRFLHHRNYADGICLLSHKISDIQDMICSLEKEAPPAGL